MEECESVSANLSKISLKPNLKGEEETCLRACILETSFRWFMNSNKIGFQAPHQNH